MINRLLMTCQLTYLSLFCDLEGKTRLRAAKKKRKIG
jgi:hypothetical protein